MIRKVLTLVVTFAVGAIVGHVSTPAILAQSDAVMAQTHKPVLMTRIYTGSDNQTHAEEVELKFTSGNSDVFKMLPVTGAEIHRTPGGNFDDWHHAPRRRYIITLSGLGELEVAGGKKISVGPGSIDLVEDTAGKGHITRVTGNEDRVTLQLPLSDEPSR